MAELTLRVQEQLSLLPAAEREAVSRFLFQCIDGHDQASKRGWRRFWARIRDMEIGEVFSLTTWTPRHGGFHRMHMKMESAVFAAQEKITDFETFRTWMKIGAGFCTWVAGPKGGVVPVPRSIAYSKLDEDGMREFHLAAVAFFREPHAQKVLWPHLKPEQREQMMETILQGFERD